MNLNELEKMAQQTAAFGVHPNGEFIYSFYTEQLQAFAKLIAEHERGACAKVCEAGINNATDWDSSIWDQACENRAAAIRARVNRSE